MSWKQYVRSVQAAQRREERAAARRYRELERAHKALQKQAEREYAAAEVAKYENYVELLVSVHVDGGPMWDWNRTAATPPPSQPVRGTAREMSARADLDSYRPGFFEKLFGGAKKRQAELEALVAHARIQDESEYQVALNVFRADLDRWNKEQWLAPRVLAHDPPACLAALEHASAFAEVETFGAKVRFEAIRNDVATLSCSITDPEVVPKEELKLTAAGKISTKELPPSRYWTLFQDHVCSCALSVSRETFAVIPVTRAIVNVWVQQLNPATGHVEPACMLAVHFTRRGLGGLRLEAVDPSDSMKNFNHRMKFKKSTGFEPVEPTSDEEGWVTT
ncbi:MAG: hypothetical protein KIT31_10570 [Deltaproteobacteria bacterium]|nr:hypothetical protein [Deltaproteobacteria bacterium]